jgi:cytochrome P450
VQSGHGDIDGLRSLAEVRAEQWEIVEPVMRERLAQPREDAVSLLAAAQDQAGKDEISDELVVDMLLHLLTGGFHTTQHLIEILGDKLATDEEVWQRLRGDRSLLPAAIEEMLRYDAPVQALRRRTLEPVRLDDQALEAGTTVGVVFGSANRDARVFDDPDTFLLDRAATRHMTFSAGIHYCPGAPVSRFEVQALFDEMLDRYERLEPAGETVRLVAPNQRTVEAMHGCARVPLRFHPDPDWDRTVG